MIIIQVKNLQNWIHGGLKHIKKIYKFDKILNPENMKKFIHLCLTIFIYTNNSILAQSDTNNKTSVQTGKPLICTEVVKIDSISKNELYQRAKISMITVFKDAKSVIQLDDKENGIIIGKASIIYESSLEYGKLCTKGSISFTIKIYVKDNKYKFEISDFIHTAIGADNDQYNYHCKVDGGLLTYDESCPYTYTIKPYAKWSNDFWNEMKTKVENNIQILILNFKRSMQIPSPNKSEW